LVLKGKVQHELACANCGAPLHDLKMLPVKRRGPRELLDQPPSRKRKVKEKKPAKVYKSRKKRKSLFKDVLEEAFDFLEDIFD